MRKSNLDYPLYLVCFTAFLVAFAPITFHPAVKMQTWNAIFAEYILLSFNVSSSLLLLYVVWTLVWNLPKLRKLSDRSAMNYLRSTVGPIFTLRSPLDILLPLIIMPATLASFTLFKTLIIRDAGFKYDALFANLDRALFLGNDPWKITHALFQSPAMTKLIDNIYHPWFYAMEIAYFMACVFIGAPQIRRVYIMTFLWAWVIVATYLAYFMASAGPAFYADFVDQSTRFGPLMDRLIAQNQEAGGLQALSYQDYLRTSYIEGKIDIGTGISAMPSMHIALAYMIALALWRLNKYAGYLGFLYTFVIWIGSVHLGWHYALDGIVSLIVVTLIWRATELYVPNAPYHNSLSV